MPPKWLGVKVLGGPGFKSLPGERSQGKGCRQAVNNNGGG